MIDRREDERVDLGEGARLSANSVVADAPQRYLIGVASEGVRDVAERVAERQASGGHGRAARFPLRAKCLPGTLELRSERRDSAGRVSGFGDERLEQVEKDRLHHRRA